VKNSTQFAFLVFLALICFGHIHQGTLAVDAIRYARISWEIVLTGNLSLFDHYSETLYVNKPPLLFWLTAAGFKLFGFSTFMAKFPAVLFTAAGLVAISAIGKRLGAVIGILSAILLIASPNFTRNMLDLSFEGMVTLGTALWLIGLISWSENRPRLSGACLLFSAILIAQSKPPYFGVLAPAAIPFLLMSNIRSIWPLIGLGVGLLIGGSWYFFQGTEYLSGFAANQVGVTLTHRYPYFENLARWVVSVLKNFAFVIIPGGYYVWKNVRHWGSLGKIEQILIAHSAMIIPIILFTAIRPRYAIVPMVALAPLAGFQLIKWFPRITEGRVRNTLWLTSAIICLIVFAGVRLHRDHEFVEYLKLHPTPPTAIQFCQGGPTPERAAGKAKMNGLLLELEFGEKYPVFSAYEEYKVRRLKVYEDQSCKEVRALATSSAKPQ
jgi:4-amino-4-deoxy-L-arabinose transferase-like glycosyltransferase